MARILVIGSINADRMVRLSAPLSKGRVQGQEIATFTGGAAANTGSALALLGHEVVLASTLGRGEEGDRMLEGLARRGLDVSQVVRSNGPVAAPMILIEPGGERTILFIAPPGGHHQPPLSVPAAFPGPWDAVYLASAAPGAMQLAHRGDAPVVAQWYGGRPRPEAEVIIAAADAQPQASTGEGPWLILTRGADGSEAFGPGGVHLRCAAETVTQVLDTTGAGDAYAAGIVHGVALGWPMARAMALAARLGARQVRVLGPAPPDSLTELSEDGHASVIPGT